MLFKRLCAIILLFAILLFLVGCGKREPIQVNISDNDELFSDHFGEFIKINDHLRYDSATRIVYIFNRNSYGYSYTPYYAANGLPYRYNPETNTFEKIDK